MKRKIFLVISTIVLLFLIGCSNLVGKAEVAAGGISDKTKQIRANSCDADDICEIKSADVSGVLIARQTAAIGNYLSVGGGVFIEGKTISTIKGSTSALVLTSDVKNVIVDGSLSAGSVNIDGKTISTQAGSTSALILTSDVKKVIVDGSLSVENSAKVAGDLTLTKLGASKRVLLQSNGEGSLTITPESGATKVEGGLSVSKLAGPGGAYACLDSFGMFYRSTKPCV